MSGQLHPNVDLPAASQVLLAPTGGAAAVRDTIDRVVPALARRDRHPTLRAALGLPVPAIEEVTA